MWLLRLRLGTVSSYLADNIQQTLAVIGTEFDVVNSVIDHATHGSYLRHRPLVHKWANQGFHVLVQRLKNIGLCQVDWRPVVFIQTVSYCVVATYKTETRFAKS